MKLTRAIPAGMADAGLASLATFILSLYAIARWQDSDPTILGIYFLYATAHLMASTVPRQLVLIPAERMTLDIPAHDRVALLGTIIKVCLPVAAGAALLVGLALPVGMASGMAISEQAPFLITAAVTALVSPLQMHARRLLHLSGRSWAAATVSVVQLGTAGSALALLVAASVDPLWIPIGALAVANLTSLGVAGAIVWSASRGRGPISPRVVAARADIDLRAVAEPGRWLLASGGISTGNNFLVEAAIVFIAGSPALALAGSAKTVAQPILVLGSGLRSVLGPASMEAAKTRDRRAGAKTARLFGGLTAGAVLGYVAFAGFDWIGNPLARLVDTAYTVQFLVIATIVANGINAAAIPGRLGLVGASREKQVFTVEAQANSGQLVAALVLALAAGTSLSAAAFAYPVSLAVLGLLRLSGFERALNNHYSTANQPTAA